MTWQNISGKEIDFLQSKCSVLLLSLSYGQKLKNTCKLYENSYISVKLYVFLFQHNFKHIQRTCVNHKCSSVQLNDTFQVWTEVQILTPYLMWININCFPFQKNDFMTRVSCRRFSPRLWYFSYLERNQDTC